MLDNPTGRFGRGFASKVLKGDSFDDPYYKNGLGSRQVYHTDVPIQEV